MQPPEAEYKKVKKSLRFSILDGSFFNIMDGFTTSFIGPYALFLNASNIIISLLSSLPDLFASFFQLSAIKVSEMFKSRKLIIVISAFLQALLWLPILLIPHMAPAEKQGLYLILLVMGVTTLNSFISPLWRSMMGELVAEHERGRFFSLRNGITAIVCFISTFSAGLILQHFSLTDPWHGFAVLFSVALLARIFSSIFIFLMYEKKQEFAFVRKKSDFTMRRFLRELPSSDYGHFVLFICLFRIAVAVASPFFALYEIRYLGYSYMQFTILCAIEILSSFIFLSLWGKINDEKGSRQVIVITGFLIPFVPLLYLFSPNFYYLMIVSVLSGAAWGGFNLAVGNFIYDASSSKDRVRYVAYFNFLHGLAIFVGALSGGLLLNLLPQTKESVLVLFLISGLLRLGIALFLFPSLREMRVVQVKIDKKLFNYSLFIKPRQGGLIEDPWDYYMAYEKKPKNAPHLDMAKLIDAEDPWKDPGQEKERDAVIRKNFMKSMMEGMNKKP